MSAKPREPVPVTAPLSESERHSMIAEAAYYRALERGFVAGRELEDWIIAEIEIDVRFTRW
jgi:hypothetical protein